MKSRFWLFLVGGLWLPAALLCTAVAQSAPAIAKLKPEQLLERAEADNGLGNLKTPWHALVRFESFDPAGVHKNGGTFEEWWFGPKSYKSVFKSELLNQTDVATEQGLFRAGDQQWPQFGENLASDLILSPMEVLAPGPKGYELVNQTLGEGDLELRCISSYRSHRPDQHIGTNMPRDVRVLPSVCFPKGSTVMLTRSTGPGNPLLTFKAIVRFEGQYVPTDVAVTQGGKSSFTVHVTQLNKLPNETAPPEPAQGSQGPLRGPILLPGSWVHIVSGEDEYQDAIMNAVPPNQSTEVVVKFQMDTEGHVHNAEVVSGPPQFAALVAKATDKLTFQPVTILGTPVGAIVTRKETFASQAGPASSSRRR